MQDNVKKRAWTSEWERDTNQWPHFARNIYCMLFSNLQQKPNVRVVLKNNCVRKTREELIWSLLRKLIFVSGSDVRSAVRLRTHSGGFYRLCFTEWLVDGLLNSASSTADVIWCIMWRSCYWLRSVKETGGKPSWHCRSRCVGCFNPAVPCPLSRYFPAGLQVRL